MTQGNFDAGESAERINDNVSLNQNVSEDYNSMSLDERRAVFNEMTTSSSDSDGLNDLIITGIDTDGDGKNDQLKDIGFIDTRFFGVLQYHTVN